MRERDEVRHVATGDAAPADPADLAVRDAAGDPGRPVDAPAPGAEEVEVTDPAGDAEVLQAVVDFIGDLVESETGNGADESAGGGADGRLPPEGVDT